MDERGTLERGARLGAAGLVAVVAAAGLAGAAAAQHGSWVAAGAAAHLAAAAVVWTAALLLARARRAAHAEALEEARLRALEREGRRRLFGGAEGQEEGGSAAAALERLRRVGTPAFAVAIAALELGLCWLLVTRFPRPDAGASLPAAAALCVAAFGLLVLGRYAFALAQRGDPRASGELEAGARRATSGALACLVAGMAQAAQHAGFPQVDQAGWLFVVVEGLLGLEGLVAALLEAYRPRRPGEAARPVFDSRLLGLVSAPGDLARSIARTVDYQFGFALSQTWFYRFVERWVAPILALALVCFWLLSTLVVVQAHEVVLVRRLGRLQDGAPLAPGLHLKLPWPIDEAASVPVGRAHEFIMGDHLEAAARPGARERTLLWTESHDDEEHHEDEGEDAEMLVLLARRVDAGAAARGEAPVNLLVAAATLRWRIADARGWLVRVDDPRALLEVLAERELSFMLGGSDLDDLLRDRGALGERLRARLQAAVDQVEVAPGVRGLGLVVEGAWLTELHPPPDVGAAFELVTSAVEQREAAVLDARATAARLGPESRAEAERTRLDAVAQARAKVELVRADAERFGAQRLLDRAGRRVYRMTAFLRTLVDAGERARKVVVGDRAGLDVDLDLSERVDMEAFGAETSPADAQGAAGAEGGR